MQFVNDIGEDPDEVTHVVIDAKTRTVVVTKYIHADGKRQRVDETHRF
jgi:hypothetical protein